MWILATACQTIQKKEEPLEAIIEQAEIDYPEVSLLGYGFEGLNREKIKRSLKNHEVSGSVQWQMYWLQHLYVGMFQTLL